MDWRNRARLRDDNGQMFRKESDGGLCPIKLLSQMKATGGAPPLAAESGCWHEDRHMLLAEAQAYLRNEMCKVKYLPAVAAFLRLLHACLGRSVADERKSRSFNTRPEPLLWTIQCIGLRGVIWTYI